MEMKKSFSLHQFCAQHILLIVQERNFPILQLNIRAPCSKPENAHFLKNLSLKLRSSKISNSSDLLTN